MTVRELRPDDWPLVESLFGEKGACGGCWCMWWRVPKGGKLWKERKGDLNRESFRREVLESAVHGVMAFEGETGVGWCRFGPRGDFPRIQSIKAIRGGAPAGTWSVVCFYILSRRRKQGVARALLDAAVRRAFELGAERVEGYPAIPAGEKPVPAVFAWTGVPRLFESAGFHKASDRTWVLGRQ